MLFFHFQLVRVFSHTTGCLYMCTSGCWKLVLIKSVALKETRDRDVSMMHEAQRRPVVNTQKANPENQ